MYKSSLPIKITFNNFLQQVGDTPTVFQPTSDGLQWAFRSLYMQVSLLTSWDQLLYHHFVSCWLDFFLYDSRYCQFSIKRDFLDDQLPFFLCWASFYIAPNGNMTKWDKALIEENSF